MSDDVGFEPLSVIVDRLLDGLRAGQAGKSQGVSRPARFAAGSSAAIIELKRPRREAPASVGDYEIRNREQMESIVPNSVAARKRLAAPASVAGS